MPFSLQLRHTKSGRTSGQDLRLQAPEIHALLDSREFLTFVDVVRCGPKLPFLLSHMMLARTGVVDVAWVGGTADVSCNLSPPRHASSCLSHQACDDAAAARHP